jgi:hypothetical protein
MLDAACLPQAGMLPACRRQGYWILDTGCVGVGVGFGELSFAPFVLPLRPLRLKKNLTTKDTKAFSVKEIQ